MFQVVKHVNMVNETAISIIYIHEEIRTVVQSYNFYLKSVKLLFAYLYNKVMLFTNLNQSWLNKTNTALNTWRKSIDIHLWYILIKPQITSCLIKILLGLGTLWCIDKGDPIKYWYCQCEYKAPVLGCCVLVLVLWYIGLQCERHWDWYSRSYDTDI